MQQYIYEQDADDECIRVTDTRKYDYYQVDNVTVDYYCEYIGAQAYGIYCILVRFGNNNHERSHISMKTLCKYARLSKHTVLKELETLEDAGLIRKVQHKKEQVNKNGETVVTNECNEYLLLAVPSRAELKTRAESANERAGDMSLPSAKIALPLVQKSDYPSANSALPLVQNFHYPSAKIAHNKEHVYKKHDYKEHDIKSVALRSTAQSQRAVEQQASLFETESEQMVDVSLKENVKSNRAKRSTSAARVTEREKCAQSLNSDVARVVEKLDAHWQKWPIGMTCAWLEDKLEHYGLKRVLCALTVAGVEKPNFGRTVAQIFAILDKQTSQELAKYDDNGERVNYAERREPVETNRERRYVMGANGRLATENRSDEERDFYGRTAAERAALEADKQRLRDYLAKQRELTSAAQ